MFQKILFFLLLGFGIVFCDESQESSIKDILRAELEKSEQAIKTVIESTESALKKAYNFLSKLWDQIKNREKYAQYEQLQKDYVELINKYQVQHQKLLNSYTKILEDEAKAKNARDTSKNKLAEAQSVHDRAKLERDELKKKLDEAENKLNEVLQLLANTQRELDVNEIEYKNANVNVDALGLEIQNLNNNFEEALRKIQENILALESQIKTKN